MTSNRLKDHLPLPFILYVTVVCILVTSGGFLFYTTQKNKIVYEKQNELAAIASLKVEQIESWKSERMRDAMLISQNREVFKFLMEEDSHQQEKELLQIFRAFTENYDYHSILLLDKYGNIRLTYPPLDSISNSKRILLSDSLITFSNLHFSEDLPGIIHIDLIVPLFQPDKIQIGTILLRINPEKTLYPLIQSWPTPSRSSETLLVSREGDSVMYMNELRHKKNTALKFKLPLKSNLPAFRAISGYNGVFEGVDYRGIPVISFLSKIPDSPWSLVAKVDRKEIYSSVKSLTIIIAVISFLVILSFVTIMIYIWRNQNIRYLKQINSTKDKFFSIISHDLRNPFACITNLAEFIVEALNKPDSSVNEELGQIRIHAELLQESAKQAIELLSNLTEWARLNSNRLVFKPEEIDITTLLNGVIEIMQTPAIQKSITLTIRGPYQLQVYADKEMISTVFRNLISNSIKFTNPGGRVYITAGKKGNRAVIKVIDSGIGMKKETIEKLFLFGEHFSTAGTRSEQGTGLGLILVKEFVSIHGGEIQVSSKVGKYSSFKVALPLSR